MIATGLSRCGERESNPHSQGRLIYSQRSSPHCSISAGYPDFRAFASKRPPPQNQRVDDRTVRIAVLLSAHVIFLSAAALRIIRGQRGHEIVARAPWAIQYYPPLVWLPFVVAYVQPFAVDLDRVVRYVGLGISVASALFAAWAMWSLGRSYGIRLDIFSGHLLKTDGPYAIVRHPMYLGILTFHLGASLALASPLLLAATALIVAPFTALRISYEERVLREAFGERYAAYQRTTPSLVPFTT
jgi:protein-S-isoprenylcysteine O-methyltransferase Ste14